MARGLKFRIKVGMGLYYPCSENKDDDQLRGKLRGYREADVSLCFRICKNPVFSWRASYVLKEYTHKDYFSFQNKGVGETNIL